MAVICRGDRKGQEILGSKLLKGGWQAGSIMAKVGLLVFRYPALILLAGKWYRDPGVDLPRRSPG